MRNQPFNYGGHMVVNINIRLVRAVVLDGGHMVVNTNIRLVPAVVLDIQT
jgi:hypothetical protein